MTYKEYPKSSKPVFNQDDMSLRIAILINLHLPNAFADVYNLQGLGKGLVWYHYIFAVLSGLTEVHPKLVWLPQVPQYHR